MNAKRLAEVLRAVAKRLDPPRSYADECEALRRELEAEAQAEFGIQLSDRAKASYEYWQRTEGAPITESIPDPASPGDVWPAERESFAWTPMRRALRRVK